MPPVIDALAFLGDNLFGTGQTYPELVTRMDGAGIDLAMVATARPINYHLGPANSAVLTLADAHADRIAALVRIDPNQPDAATQTRTLLAEGARGVFLHPREEVFPVNGDRVDPVAQLCAEHGVPLVIAAGHGLVSEPLQIAELAGRHPDAKILMTNAGQLNISGLGHVDALTALRNHANLSIATNGVYRQDFIEGAASEFGAHRVMFASASPILDPAYETLRIHLARLAPVDKAAVLGGTACDLFCLA